MASQGATAHHEQSHGKTHSAYKSLLLMGVIHVFIMYAIMFSMVHSVREVFQNLNTLYMAGMMAAPMFLVMMPMMKGMYPNRKLNALIYGFSLIFLLTLFLFTRKQTFIGDRQFLRSMIPHHSGAVLMCKEAKLKDPEIVALCDSIVKSQLEEVDQMKKILNRL